MRKAILCRTFGRGNNNFGPLYLGQEKIIVKTEQRKHGTKMQKNSS